MKRHLEYPECSVYDHFRKSALEYGSLSARLELTKSRVGEQRDNFKELADKHLTNGGGGVLSFGIKGTPEQEAEFLNNIKLFHYHVNLGDARSLIVDSPNTTHSELTEDEFKLAEIPRNLIRISAGLEDADDLIEDLEQAFKAAGLL